MQQQVYKPAFRQASERMTPLPEPAVRAAWAAWLGGAYPWNYFVTCTLSEAYRRVNYYQFLGHVGLFFWLWFHLEGEACGQCWRTEGAGHAKFMGPWARAWSKARGRFVWAYGVERQGRGALHLHSLLWTGRLLKVLNYSLGLDAWAWGRCRFERPKSVGDCVNYTTKEVLKGGDVVLSPSFNSAPLVHVGGACEREVGRVRRTGGGVSRGTGPPAGGPDRDNVPYPCPKVRAEGQRKAETESVRMLLRGKCLKIDERQYTGTDGVARTERIVKMLDEDGMDTREVRWSQDLLQAPLLNRDFMLGIDLRILGKGFVVLRVTSAEEVCEVASGGR